MALPTSLNRKERKERKERRNLGNNNGTKRFTAENAEKNGNGFTAEAAESAEKNGNDLELGKNGKGWQGSEPLFASFDFGPWTLNFGLTPHS